MIHSIRWLLATALSVTIAFEAVGQNDSTGGSPPAPVDEAGLDARSDRRAFEMADAGSAGRQEPLVLPAGGADVDCACQQRFNVGDRVISTVNMPDGNEQIRIGDMGTVVCGRPFLEGDLMLVEWDIDNGHDGLGVCDCPSSGLPEGSDRGWYVFCDEIAPLPDNSIECACDASFHVGQSVVAAVDNPDGNAQIFAGDTGTVVCGAGLGAFDILVSWDITNGHDGFDGCTCPGDELPDGSNNGWYVTCDQIRGIEPVELCICDDLIAGRTVIATQDNPSAQPNVLTGDSGVLVCGNEPFPLLPVLIAWDISSGHDGNGNCDCPTQQLPPNSESGWFVECDEIRQIEPGDIWCVCDQQFDVGDKVVSRIDNNGGNPDIDAGHVGTMICGRQFGAGLLLVAWDTDEGHDGLGLCDCPIEDLPTGSSTGWYVHCDTVAPLGFGPIDCACDAAFQPGDLVRSTVDNPDGNPQILQGDVGTVMCGDLESFILVAWDITSGHDGGAFCDCPSRELPDGSVNGWWMTCNDMVLVSDCPPDLDASGAVGFADLLRILSIWGPCFDCSEDVDGDGVVGFSDLISVLSAWGACP